MEPSLLFNYRLIKGAIQKFTNYCAPGKLNIINVETKDNEGAEFIIQLPIV